jgi:LPS sulfotransferase NodH
VTVQSWAERQQEIAHVAARQLFFIGGAPRSGTTWLQQILDSHPEVSCQGEGLFLKHLAEPLEGLISQRRQTLAAKNTDIFSHTGGYPLPADDDTEFLLGTAILLALHQQIGAKSSRAIGEKTPENVFFFPRLKRLFPTAKFIGIARDPRDVLTSAWHFFPRPAADKTSEAAKTAFIRLALPSLRDGARAMLALAERHPADCVIVTYEALRQAPTPVVAALFRFLGVSDRDDIVADALARTAFAPMAGGRPPGEARDGSFFRKGVVGDWRGTLTPVMNALVLAELGWMFSRFGWRA